MGTLQRRLYRCSSGHSLEKGKPCRPTGFSRPTLQHRAPVTNRTVQRKRSIWPPRGGSPENERRLDQRKMLPDEIGERNARRRPPEDGWGRERVRMTYSQKKAEMKTRTRLREAADR